MRTLGKSIAALGLVALMASPALAQQGRGGGRGFGFGGGGISMLLSNKSVQAELKLDADQVEKAAKMAEAAREKFMASRSALEGLEGEERFKKMQAIGKEANDEAKKAAKEFLKPEQLKRMYQIQHQVMGAQAFSDEYVVGKLKLTDAQKSDIAAIVSESNGKMRELFQEMQNDPQGTRAKITELRKETLSQAEAKLTDEQKTTWKDLLGTHFDIKFERPAGR